jgi:hypothetical protein
LLREGKWKPKAESLSYLTVSCDDLPEDAVALPERIRARNGERGNYFHTRDGLPIQGPKTEEEAIEDQKIENDLLQHCLRWADQLKRYRFQTPMDKKNWIWEDLMSNGTPWEAIMANAKWTQGDERFPCQNQAITIRPAKSSRQEEHEKWWKDSEDCMSDYWFLGDHEENRPSPIEGMDQIEDEDSYFIKVRMPEELELRIMQIPKQSS